MIMREYPSAGLLARASVPMVLPGLFSTMTGCFHNCCRVCAISRPEISSGPPGGKGTMRCTGRDGYSSARAAAVHRAPANAAAAAMRAAAAAMNVLLQARIPGRVYSRRALLLHRAPGRHGDRLERAHERILSRRARRGMPVAVAVAMAATFPHSRTPAMNRSTGWLVLVIGAAALGAVLFIHYSRQHRLAEQAETPPAAAQQQAPAEPQVRHPIENAQAEAASSDQPLPTLTGSDAAAKDTLQGLIGAKAFSDFIEGQ